MKIQDILFRVDSGEIALPEFQRGFVWNRTQVRSLVDSLYRRHPVGSLLTWSTGRANTPAHRGEMPVPVNVKLLLDGQQRVTSLYGVIRGAPPPFFEGDGGAFSGLHFDLKDEAFEFYAPVRMRDNPRWVSVTELMKPGSLGRLIGLIHTNEDLQQNAEQYTARLNSLAQITDVDLHVEDIAGEDKNVDIVVDIFNKVNSNGTKLSKGDLALAKICAEWSEARAELKRRLAKWEAAGYKFKLEWLLRCVNAIATGDAVFSALNDVGVDDISVGLEKSEKHVDYLLNLVSSRLGLDHDRVLGSRYSFPLMVKYLESKGGQIRDARERDRLLFWYTHTLLWGRYSGSTETVLSQDLQAVSQDGGGLDKLIENLRRNRGDLRIAPSDFAGSTIGARFYPLLYMLTRIYHARDWNSDLELSSHMLGKHSSLELHHIFPKSKLKEYGYDRGEVNALANFTFLTRESNRLISNENPDAYIRRFMSQNPGAIESHWIPTDDPDLWKIENYRDFLTARQKLLAEAANELLESLNSGSLAASSRIGDGEVAIGGAVNDEEHQILLDINVWVVGQELPEGEVGYELVTEESGELQAVLDLAWPDGVQEGLSQPVALLIDEDAEIESIANQAGFRVYTNVESLKRYIRQDILALDPAAD